LAQTAYLLGTKYLKDMQEADIITTAVKDYPWREEDNPEDPDHAKLPAVEFHARLPKKFLRDTGKKHPSPRARHARARDPGRKKRSPRARARHARPRDHPAKYTGPIPTPETRSDAGQKPARAKYTRPPAPDPPVYPPAPVHPPPPSPPQVPPEPPQEAGPAPTGPVDPTPPEPGYVHGQSTSDGTDHYHTLGLLWGASADHVCAAYTRIMRAHHPNRHYGEGDKARQARNNWIQLVQNAKDVLTNPLQKMT
jgi:hypothetical protein